MSDKIKNLFKILILIFITLYSFNFASAQISQINDLSLTTTPKNPNPGESFSATIQSYITDLDKADIIWSVNGQQITSGFGTKQINLRAPEAGKGYKLDILVTTPAGKKYTFSKVFLSSSVSIVWETLDGYVPEWYEGRSMIPEGGTVRIYAMPNINDGSVLSKDIVFKWSVNDELQTKYSGLGKDYLDYKLLEEQGDDINIELEITPKNSSETILKRFSIAPKSPELIVYKDSPLYGTLYNNALYGTESISEREFSLIAEPFYTSAKKNFNDLSIYWNINDIPTGEGDSFKKFFKIPTSSFGISKISASIENAKSLLQDAKTNFTLSF